MVKTFYGVDLESYDVDKDCVSSYIRKFQCWEPMMSNVMLNILENEKGVCIDVGAYIGYYSFLMAKFNKTYAIEASPETFEKLCKTYNKIPEKDNLVLISAAISNTDGAELNFYNEEDENVGHSRVVPNETGLKVKTITIDSLVKNNCIEDILIMKIDVEGHELNVVKGMKEVLEKRMVKYFFFEVSPSFVGIDEAAKTVEMVMEHGYECYDLYNRKQGYLHDYADCTYTGHKVNNIRDLLAIHRFGQADVIMIRK